MTDKVLKLAADTETLQADVAERQAQLAPLADAERKRQQEAADAAQREVEEQQRRCACVGRPPRMPATRKPQNGFVSLELKTCSSHSGTCWRQGSRGGGAESAGGRAQAAGSGSSCRGGGAPGKGQARRP